MHHSSKGVTQFEHRNTNVVLRMHATDINPSINNYTEYMSVLIKVQPCKPIENMMLHGLK